MNIRRLGMWMILIGLLMASYGSLVFNISGGWDDDRDNGSDPIAPRDPGKGLPLSPKLEPEIAVRMRENAHET
jgi:hypothetical protein